MVFGILRRPVDMFCWIFSLDWPESFFSTVSQVVSWIIQKVRWLSSKLAAQHGLSSSPPMIFIDFQGFTCFIFLEIVWNCYLDDAGSSILEPRNVNKEKNYTKSATKPCCFWWSILTDRSSCTFPKPRNPSVSQVVKDASMILIIFEGGELRCAPQKRPHRKNVLQQQTRHMHRWTAWTLTVGS